MEAHRSQDNGGMMPLPVAQGRWLVISTDFVTGLPTRNWGSDMILVIVHGFFKRCHPCAKELTGLTGKMYPSTNVLSKSAPKNAIKYYHRSNSFTIQRTKPLYENYRSRLTLPSALTHHYKMLREN